MAARPPPPRFVSQVTSTGMEKIKDAYCFMYQVTFSDGDVTKRRWNYEELFKFQCGLLDRFPEAAGANGNTRIIPTLPGKKMLTTKSKKDIANKRRPQITAYLQGLLALPKSISASAYVLAFLDSEYKPPARVGVVKEGWLYKKGELVKSWKKRHFVLDAAGRLCYYRNVRTAQNQLTPSGIILMDDVTVVAKAGGSSPVWPNGVALGNCFACITEARAFYLYATSSEEAHAWQAAIASASRASLSEDLPEDPHIRRGSISGMSSASSSTSLHDILAETSDLPFSTDVPQSPARRKRLSVSPAVTPTTSRRGSACSDRLSSQLSNSSLTVPEEEVHHQPTAAWGLEEDASKTRPKWEFAESADGKRYYINTHTLETAWELPPGVSLES